VQIGDLRKFGPVIESFGALKVFGPREGLASLSLEHLSDSKICFVNTVDRLFGLESLSSLDRQGVHDT
jgi:hypothetical protein